MATLGRLHEEKTLRSLLEALPDAIVIVDARGRIALVNSQTEQLFGYPRAELLDQPVEKLVPQRFTAHAQHRQGYFAEPRLRPMGHGLTLFALRKDGSEFPVEISLSPLETDEGLLVTAAIRDVTDRRRIERDLREKNLALEAASRTKDRFLATMSHELRTPLNAIIGFTGTLLMKLPGPLTVDQESQLRTVQSSARHLLALINDLLDLAKIESGRVELHAEPVVLQSVVEEVVNTLRPAAADKRLALRVELPPDPLTIAADRRAISQILLNLLGNAVKFTERGQVMVRLAARVVDDRPELLLSVSDTGAGIRAEDRDRLFRAFEQLETTQARRHEGTGLGLHLSQRLAELLGGRIDMESAVGHGSTFTLVLPQVG